MADSKISGLSDGGAPQSGDEFVVARSTSDQKIAAENLPGFEFDYVEQTSNVSITGTSDASANSIIDGNAKTYDGSTRIKIEFWLPGVNVTFGSAALFNLYDGATDLGRIGLLQSQGTISGSPQTLILGMGGTRFLTPSAASHTFHIKAWTNGTATVIAGAGGSATFMPAWYRIVKA